MSSKAKQEKTTGEIVNLMSVDAQRLMDVTTFLYGIYSAPLQIIVAILLLYYMLGPSIFAGVAVMVLLIPLNFAMSVYGRKYQVCGCEWVDGWVFVLYSCIYHMHVHDHVDVILHAIYNVHVPHVPVFLHVLY